MFCFRFGTKENLYLILYSAFAFLSVIDLSLFSSQLITNVLFGGIIIGLLMIVVYDNRVSQKRFILYSLILFAFSTQLFTNGQKKNVIYGLLIVASFVSEKKKIAIVSVLSCMFGFALVAIASFMGIIPNLIFYRADKTAYALGFGYYGTYPYLILFAELLYLYIKNKVTWLEIAILTLINQFVYYFSSLRLPYYLYFISIIMYIVLEKFEWINLNRKAIKILAVAGYPMCLILSIYSALNYNQTSAFWSKLNWILSDRIRLMSVAFERYDVKLFGQVIVKNTHRLLYGVDPNYFFIDSGYISSLMENGIILTVLLLILHSYFFYYVCKKNDRKVFMLLTAVMLFSLVNGVWTSLYYNPLLLLIFSRKESGSDMKIFKKYNLKKEKITIRVTTDLLNNSTEMGCL